MPVLEVQDVSYTYGEIKALDSISLQVTRGEFVGLLGPNGSGKSTLLKTLAGIFVADSGKIFLQEKLIQVYEKKARSRIVAYVPQTLTCDFPFSVAEFVQMGRAPHLSFFGTCRLSDSKVVEAALEKTGCASFSSRPITSLSGGEKQRVLLSQAFAQEADLFILDEPVSHLDIGHQLQVLQMLKRETSEGKTVIASFHELNLAAQFADRILLLSNGKQAACGKPLDVLTPDLLRQVYGVKGKILAVSGGIPVIVFDL